MLARVVIDDLHAVAAGVSHEDAAGFGVEGAMIEGASCRRRDLDLADHLERHGYLPAWRCNRHQV